MGCPWPADDGASTAKERNNVSDNASNSDSDRGNDDRHWQRRYTLTSLGKKMKAVSDDDRDDRNDERKQRTPTELSWLNRFFWAGWTSMPAGATLCVEHGEKAKVCGRVCL